MNNPQSGTRPDEPENGETKVGRILQQARLSGHIDVNKICTELRISPQALEALEQGNYHLLPGDPYIRALLGSLSRYLGIDPTAIIKVYNKEIGAVAATPSISPYKDKAHTYKTAHKQIFIIIVIALFIVLFFLIGKLNKGEFVPAAPPDPASAAAEGPRAPDDTSTESRALAPDSAETAALRKDSDRNGGNLQVPDSLASQRAHPAPAAVDSSAMNSAVIKPLIDSVWIKVQRSGREDFITLLRLGKQVQVTHQDTIVVISGKRQAVEVTLGSETVIPTRKRFKIYGKTLKTF